MSSVLANLNPRKHLSARIGWAVFTIIAIAAQVCAWLVALATKDYIHGSANRSLQQYASQIHREIDATLTGRLSIVRALATQLGQTSSKPEDLQRALGAVQTEFPEFGWIGLVTTEGAVIAATAELQDSGNIPQRSWFINGLRGPYLGDIHREPAAGLPLSSAAVAESSTIVALKYIDIAAPVINQTGQTTAVVAVHLDWEWIQDLQQPGLSDVDNADSALQQIHASDNGIVFSGPANLIGRPMPDLPALSENGKYQVGLKTSVYGDSATLDWTVAVRRESAQTTSISNAAQRLVIATIISAATVAALLIVYTVNRLTSKLRLLSRDADLVSKGLKQQLNPIAGNDEVSRIRQVLANSIGNLQQEKQTLQTLNSELDKRVEDRTRDIERLSAESREIALTQQRLRFARDMHDTLAHSMMAVLTQIRLVRKIRHNLAEEEIEDELQRAEEAAKTGLAEARAAIQQIRSANLYDKGVDGALTEMVDRFRARTGIHVNLRIDPNSNRQQDQRGETVIRMAEEAIRNIEKHANAREVNISLDRSDVSESIDGSVPVFHLTIFDDGIGFNVNEVASDHYGLVGLREQAALIGGELVIDSNPGSGTAISLSYPAYPA